MATRNRKTHKNSFRYTPTLVAVANVDGTPTVVGSLMVHVVGRLVRVSGAISVDPTAGATLTRVGVPLPFTGVNFAAADELSGHATAQAAISGGHVEADATNDRAEVRLTSIGTAAETWRISFEYMLPN